MCHCEERSNLAINKIDPMEDKFLIYKKWFWIGMAVGFLNGVAGLIYGIALAVEPEHRKEGAVIIIWSIVAFAITFSLAMWLQSKGVIPRYVPTGAPIPDVLDVDLID